MRFVNGRKAVLMAIDVMLAQRPNVQKITDALQAELDKNPAEFFREVVRPLIPASMLETTETDPDNAADRYRTAVASFDDIHTLAENDEEHAAEHTEHDAEQ